MLYFTADWHLDHENIVKTRPFRDVTEMNNVIIDNINSVVREKDTLWILGDVGWFRVKDGRKRAKELLNRITCRDINLVFGNHDSTWLGAYFNLAFRQHLVRYCKERIFLSHYAAVTWDRSHYGLWHCHGHSHGGLNSWKEEHMPNARSLDVGVDAHDFKPWSFDEVREFMLPRKPFCPVFIDPDS